MSILFLIKYISFLIVVCYQVCLSQSVPKKIVTLHALVPRHPIVQDLNRTINVKFQRSARMRLFRTHRNLLRLFDFRVKFTVLHHDSPDEILQAFCDTTFSTNTITLFHINNPIFMSARKASNKYINQLANYLGLPMISWDSEYSAVSSTNSSRNIQIAPTLQHQSRAMLKMLQNYNWSDFSVVTTRAAGYDDFLWSLRAVVRESQRQATYTAAGIKTFKYKILKEIFIPDGRNSTNVNEELSKLLETHTRVILLHSNNLESKYILDEAAKIGLTTKEYVWILTSAAKTRGSGNVAYRGFPLGLFAISYDVGKSVMREAVETAVDIWLSALNKMASNKTVLQATQLEPSFSCNSTTSYWRDGEVVYKFYVEQNKNSFPSWFTEGQTAFIWVCFLKNTVLNMPRKTAFTETGVLKHTELKIINVQKAGFGKKYVEVGTWTWKGLSMKGITWSAGATNPPKGKPDRYFLKVVTVEEHPYVIFREPDQQTGTCGHNSVPCRAYPRDEQKKRTSNVTKNVCCTGLSIDLLKTFSEELNFDYDLFEEYDGQWGYEDKSTGEWNGIMGSLIKKEADVAVTALTITPERFKHIEFSVPYLETGITIMVALREGAISPTAFLEPYDYPSWCLILVFSVHATGASIFIFEWLSPYGLDQGHTSMREHKFSLFRSFWLIWAMLFGAAVSTDAPRGISSRFLANLWALFALVFLASYTANLAAFMITKEEYYDLIGIDDNRLRNPQTTKPPFKFATIPNGTTDLSIMANHPKMHQYMKKYNKPTIELGIRALKEQNLQAFIYDASVLEYYVGRDDGCKLVIVGDWYARNGYGIGFPKGSPWLEQINTVLLEMQDVGTIEKLQRFWLAGACKTKKKKGLSSHTLGILNFTSAFILLGGGMVLGALLLILEHMYFRFGRKSLQKWDKKGCCSLISLSMGKSLTFEQSVMDAIDFAKKYKCKNPMCETQLWKVRHELDLALVKIDALQKQIAEPKPSEDTAVWKYNPDATRQLNGVPRRRGRDIIEPAETTAHVVDELASVPQNGKTPDDGSRATPKGNKKADGKYYFGVEDNVEMESAF